MIFYRRVIQAELDNLRRHLDGFVVNRLAKRLNATDRDRLAAMWEVIILSALCENGAVAVEVPTKSGRQPDVLFSGDLSFVADITSISDQGLEDRNPVEELSYELERAKTALGLPSGGLVYDIGSTTRRNGSGERVDLRIPNRVNIRDFVERRIVPEIRARMEAGEMPIRFKIDDEEAELSVMIDPSKGPFNSGSYASYGVAGTIDRNPLASALQRKADQLRDAEGLRGIFVCDTGSSSIQSSMFGSSGFSPKQIVSQFLRTNDHIDFVITLTVWEQQFGALEFGKRDRRIDGTVYCKRGLACEAQLKSLSEKLFARFPKPRATADNGRRQGREPIYQLGFHGGYTMSNTTVKISLREMTELLAGRLTVADIHDRNRSMSHDSQEFPDHFERLLHQGRLPVGVKIEAGTPADDDWIEFTFGEPDPAISRFQ